MLQAHPYDILAMPVSLQGWLTQNMFKLAKYVLPLSTDIINYISSLPAAHVCHSENALKQLKLAPRKSCITHHLTLAIIGTVQMASTRITKPTS
jgi:hypothetical protein